MTLIANEKHFTLAKLMGAETVPPFVGTKGFILFRFPYFIIHRPQEGHQPHFLQIRSHAGLPPIARSKLILTASLQFPPTQ